jgi:hypothetical protein
VSSLFCPIPFASFTRFRPPAASSAITAALLCVPSYPSPTTSPLFSHCHIPSRGYAHKRKTSKMPSKKQVVEEKIPLGRPGNSLKSGIVGLANVGKSTLFQAITKSNLGNPAVCRVSPPATPETLRADLRSPPPSRTSPMPLSTPRRRVLSSPTIATTGCARSTTPSPACPPT